MKVEKFFRSILYLIQLIINYQKNQTIAVCQAYCNNALTQIIIKVGTQQRWHAKQPLFWKLYTDLSIRFQLKI